MRLMAILMALLLTACASSSGNKSVYVDSNQQDRAKIHAELGSGYYQENQMQIALEEFTKAVTINPNYSSGFNGLAMTYAAIHEDVKAEESFKRALSLDAQSSEAHNNFGSFLCSRGRIDESIVHFQEAVKNPLYTTPFVAYMNAGYCSLRKPNIDNAERFFGLALQYQPLLHNASYQLAKIYYGRKQYDLAQNTMRNALANNPDPDMLVLAVKVERQLGNKDAAIGYAYELKRKYPDAPQSQSLVLGAE